MSAGGTQGKGWQITSALETPADATWISEWDTYGDTAIRVFDVKEWTIDHADYSGERDDITVTIHGTQQADGRVGRAIFVACPADPLAPGEVRELAAALIAAADAADQG